MPIQDVGPDGGGGGDGGEGGHICPVGGGGGGVPDSASGGDATPVERVDPVPPVVDPGDSVDSEVLYCK